MPEISWTRSPVRSYWPEKSQAGSPDKSDWQTQATLSESADRQRPKRSSLLSFHLGLKKGQYIKPDYQVSSIKYQVSSSEYRVPSIEYRVSSIKNQVSRLAVKVLSFHLGLNISQYNKTDNLRLDTSWVFKPGEVAHHVEVDCVLIVGEVRETWRRLEPAVRRTGTPILMFLSKLKQSVLYVRVWQS